MSDQEKIPKTIGEIKNDSRLWTPQQMALRFIEDCRDGKINPSRAVIIYEDGDCINHFQAGMGTVESRFMAFQFCVLNLIEINMEGVS